MELLYWDTFDTGGGEVVDTLIDQFEAANPGVTINRELQDFDNLRTILQTSLAAGEGPDVFFWGPGAGFMQPLIDAELLLPLDEYADEFGWRERIFPWTFESVTFDDALYGLGNELEYIGVYYNTAIFEQLGLEEPETFDELVAIAEAVKAEGITPFAFTNQPGWPCSTCSARLPTTSPARTPWRTRSSVRPRGPIRRSSRRSRSPSSIGSMLATTSRNQTAWTTSRATICSTPVRRRCNTRGRGWYRR